MKSAVTGRPSRFPFWTVAMQVREIGSEAVDDLGFGAPARCGFRISALRGKMDTRARQEFVR